AIVFLEEIRPGVYATTQHERRLELATEADLQAFEKAARDAGLYPYRCRPGDPESLRESGAIATLFEHVMRQRLEEWMALSDERLAHAGVRCYIMGGNDDPPEVLEALKGARLVQDPDGQVVRIDEDCEMISCGWSNPTPWHTPRECSEEELGQRIEAMMARVQ